jgi:hypothetical protein
MHNFIRILWAPWRWRSYSAETCSSNIDILNTWFTLLWICIPLVLFHRNLKNAWSKFQNPLTSWKVTKLTTDSSKSYTVSEARVLPYLKPCHRTQHTAQHPNITSALCPVPQDLYSYLCPASAPSTWDKLSEEEGNQSETEHWQH